MKSVGRFDDGSTGMADYCDLDFSKARVAMKKPELPMSFSMLFGKSKELCLPRSCVSGPSHNWCRYIMRQDGEYVVLIIGIIF